MRFTLGLLVATKAVHEKMKADRLFWKNVIKSIERYTKCDWGDLCEADKAENESAIKNGERIFALYKICGEKVYIITEHDRSVTTILFAYEY